VYICLRILTTFSFCQPVNVALGKPTEQSSTYSSYVSSYAVDGTTDGGFLGSNPEGSHTKEQEYSPWWQVDLQDFFYINKLVVWHRTDCCTDRANGFIVQVFRNGVEKFKSDPQTVTATTIKTEIDVGEFIVGDKVMISLPGQTQALQLAEVQVYATKPLNADEKVGTIRNHQNEELCLTVEALEIDSLVKVQTCNDSWNQVWKFNFRGELRIGNDFEYCVDTRNTNVYANLHITECNGATRQQWRYDEEAVNRIVHTESGYHVGVSNGCAGAKDDSYAELQYRGTCGEQQNWKFQYNVSTIWFARREIIPELGCPFACTVFGYTTCTLNWNVLTRV